MMNTRYCLTVVCFCCVLSCECALSAQQTKSRPNVLFISADDLNDWVGCLGGHEQARTPVLDRLASQGTLFTNAHCQAPICGPSRASLLTGLLPSTSGIYGQIDDQYLQGASDATQASILLTNYFRQNGYLALGVGKVFHKGGGVDAFDEYGTRMGGFGPRPKERMNYDPKWLGKDGHTITDWGPYPENDEQMPDHKIASWAIDQLGQHHEKPFFLAVGFHRPHVPWHVPPHWFNLFDQAELTLPPYREDDLDDLPEIAVQANAVPVMPTTEWAIETNQWPAIVHAYLASIAFVDYEVGRVLKSLEESEYADNTVIVFWSDHGYHIGEKNRFSKFTVWERSTRVPLIIAGPGITEGQTCASPVGLVDMYPTLTDLCGLPPNPGNDGRSLTPLLRDPKCGWQHPAITTYGRGNHSIRTESHRYVHYENGSEELYDHRIDSNEWDNIASHPEQAELKQRLKAHIPLNSAPWASKSRNSINAYFRDGQQLSRKE